MRPKPITISEVEYTAFRLANALMSWDEPIPDFGSRFPNILESCLNQPFVRFANKDLYRGLLGKASILFYLMIKNHPFQNGNKRIAIMTLLYFLYKNGKWLKISDKELYNFALRVAKSNVKNKEKIIIHIKDLVYKYIINLSEIS